MDMGGFRDMHRHRRCTQIIQSFTALHGYETPTSADLPPISVNDQPWPAASGVLAETGILAEAGILAQAGILAETGILDETGILAQAGILDDFQSAIEQAHQASAQIAAGGAPEAAQSALYLLPLATRIRALFKMDFAEAQYISELRSAPAGHFSYRRVAWEMFLALEREHPTLAMRRGGQPWEDVPAPMARPVDSVRTSCSCDCPAIYPPSQPAAIEEE